MWDIKPLHFSIIGLKMKVNVTIKHMSGLNHRYYNAERDWKLPKQDGPMHARCNEVMLFIVNYKGAMTTIYDGTWCCT